MEQNIKVEVKDLCKNFGSLEVLKDCNFNIKQGEFVCVVGPTGCGKTTFLNMLSCLDGPTSGAILIDGEPANPKKHNLSFVFQEPSAFPWLTVEENIKYGLKIKKNTPEYIKEQSDRIIELMDLDKYRNHYPHELSVSAEQKIVIGRAFAMNPDLLLMDEPYGQMDIKTRFYLEDEVIRLWKNWVALWCLSPTTWKKLSIWQSGCSFCPKSLPPSKKAFPSICLVPAMSPQRNSSPIAPKL